MATKVKSQGPRFKKFEIWTKMAKVPKPQGPKSQFTLSFILLQYYKPIKSSIRSSSARTQLELAWLELEFQIESKFGT
ncbi:hypothetical protein Hanom_Chr05g00472121 [Helianthus anomalus]